MSVKVNLLREAVDLMRQRAKGTTEGRWELGRTTTLYMNGHAAFVLRADGKPGVRASLTAMSTDAEHMISWDPFVALAVADLLERAANDYETEWDTPECACAEDCVDASHEKMEFCVRCDNTVSACPCIAPFVAVARGYLRRESGDSR